MPNQQFNVFSKTWGIRPPSSNWPWDFLTENSGKSGTSSADVVRPTPLSKYCAIQEVHSDYTCKRYDPKIKPLHFYLFILLQMQKNDRYISVHIYLLNATQQTTITPNITHRNCMFMNVLKYTDFYYDCINWLNKITDLFFHLQVKFKKSSNDVLFLF